MPSTFVRALLALAIVATLAVPALGIADAGVAAERAGSREHVAVSHRTGFAGQHPARTGAPAAETDPNQSTSGPALLSAYPNPVAEGDRGEFVVVRLHEPGNWSLTDEESTVALPSNVSGTVAVTAAPESVAALVDRPVVAVEEMLSLANGGETVLLRRGNRTVDSLAYEDAPESQRYRAGEGFVPLGATDFAVNASGPTEVTAFVLPDAPGVPIELLRSADRRILLAAYTLTSRRAAEALVAAARRGVRVRVLVEGGPVGGMTRRQAYLLDRVVEAGGEVRVIDGPRARYDYHYAQYRYLPVHF